ncbi:MAG: FlgD immunoglobulin-like domain containing protein [Candidatus Krumholzibacteriia bacterium]|nr:T9SS type A sorting domain-containing protein [bacterium]
MKRMNLLLAGALLLVAAAAQAQDVVTIYDLQTDLVAANTLVTIEGKVVTGIDAVPSGYGFFVQEPAGGQNSGLYVFIGVTAAPDVVIGDIVDVTGVYNDYGGTGTPGSGLCELNLAPAYGGDGSYTVVGSGAVPTPELLRAWQTSTLNPVEAESWECVLVRHENVERTNNDLGFGEWFGVEFGYVDNDSTRFDADGMYSGAVPPVATQLTSVTGVVNYTFGDWKVTPRGEYDLVYVGVAPAPNLDWACATGDASIDVQFDREVEVTTAENPLNYFLDLGTVSTASVDALNNQLVHLTLAGPMTPEILLNLTVIDVQNTDGVPMTPQATQFWGGLSSVPFSQYPDAGGDSSAVAGQVITVRGVVHSKFDVYGNHVYIEDVNSTLPLAPYNGLEVYCPALLSELEEGDEVIFADYQTEYFNQTSLTQPFLYYEKVSSGNAVAAAQPITIGDMTDVSLYEPYESALVRVENVEVVERGGAWNFYNWSVTQDGLNWLHVGDMGDYSYVEGLGDSLNINGTLRYEFGEYVLMPRRDADIEILYQNPVGADEVPAAALLGQNHPNPFNPKTEISFSLGQAGAVSLDVFDASGRKVKTLLAQPMQQGQHTATWNGDTDAGTPAASGLYFYRLRANGVDETRKMMLLK